MFIAIDDFKIKPQNFDLTRGDNIMRIACGLFYLPHIAGKFIAFGVVNPGTAKFFAAAGFSPAEAWVLIAALAELAAGVCLTLGLCTRFAALGSVALMAIAVYSLQVVKGFGWTWNTGGYEYPVFWGLCSAAVAIEAWRAWFATHAAPQRTRLVPAE